MFFLNRNCDHFDIDWINILHRQIWTSSVHLFPCWSHGNFLTSQFQTVTKRNPSPHFGTKPTPNWRHKRAWTKPALTYKHLETRSYSNWHWRPHWSIMSIFSNKATNNNFIKVKPQHSLLHCATKCQMNIQSVHRLVPQVNCICRILWDPIRADKMLNNNRELNVLCLILSPQIQGGSHRSQFVCSGAERIESFVLHIQKQRQSLGL